MDRSGAPCSASPTRPHKAIARKHQDVSQRHAIPPILHSVYITAANRVTSAPLHPHFAQRSRGFRSRHWTGTFDAHGHLTIFARSVLSTHKRTVPRGDGSRDLSTY
jgi:hypothetical protein